MEDKFLSHYGVIGMKWGVRRAQKMGTQYSSGHTKKLSKLAKRAKDSADEWDEMAKDAESRGKMNKAAKYKANAKADRDDAKVYSKRAKRSQTVDDLRKNDLEAAKKSGKFLAEYRATQMTLSRLREMNGAKGERLGVEKKIQPFIDSFINGMDLSEAAAANQYIYRT